MDEGSAAAVDADSGRCQPGDWDWDWMQPAREQGDRIGMLLDLDQGSLTACG